jgi:WXXGXW repeat (2 copies)
MKRTTLLGILLAVTAIAAALPAGAQVEIRARIAPPALRAEVIPRAPGPGHYWIGGHWGWEGRRWAWNGGHWVEARRGEVWVRPHWAQVGAEWVFAPGHWTAIVPPPAYTEVVTETAPPVARVEVVSPAPGADYFWVPGFWRWAGGTHAWVAGRWERSRRDEFWVPEHWVRVDRRWHFNGGHWQHR